MSEQESQISSDAEEHVLQLYLQVTQNWFLISGYFPEGQLQAGGLSLSPAQIKHCEALLVHVEHLRSHYRQF
jgi:hypothetical protein